MSAPEYLRHIMFLFLDNSRLESSRKKTLSGEVVTKKMKSNIQFCFWLIVATLVLTNAAPATVEDGNRLRHITRRETVFVSFGLVRLDNKNFIFVNFACLIL